ncbi:MAG TPA: ABC transporter ATP-binding protein [Candidatus Scatomorpha merdavium]|nr:ABC transporter ATP-binding protein [Candidatus Scatomorpha merdavium]
MPVLECVELGKSYGGGFALEGLTLGLEEGRVLGLLGPNGSGKTTLIKLIAGLIRPERGAVRVCGEAPGRGTKALVSYMPERQDLPDWMRLHRLLDYFADFFADFDRAAAEEHLRRLGLDTRARVRSLSKGERQKARLALAMSRAAKLYLLDEPFGGVDPAARDYILETILAGRAPGAAVLISTHMIAELEPALDDAAFLGGGRLVMAGPAEQLRRERGMSLDALFREVFRC